MREIGSAAVAFSSGVDSTFLLRTAHEELGDKAVAVTVRSQLIPRHELDEAAAFCRQEGIRHEIIDFDALSAPAVIANPPDRCYHCKKEVFGLILAFARGAGLAAVLEGSNLDDDGDYRPGRCAIKELGIRSPLHEAGLSKAEIRALSREMVLPTWDKPSFACLASRFPYGERITAEGLERVDGAERWLRERLGLAQLRVRAHETTEQCAEKRFDFCSIINARSGRCSENCKWCAQSAHWKTGCETYGWVGTEACVKAAKRLGFQVCCGGILGMGETDEQLVEFAFALKEIAPDSIPVNILHPIEGTPLGQSGVLDPERVIDSVAILRLVNPSTPLRFAGGRRDMSDETAARCIYVGMSAGIAGPLLTTPGADFDDDRELAVRAGYAVGGAPAS